MEIRSFLAFELPDALKDAIFQVSDAVKKLSLDIRWVKAGNLHLTIVFMGDVLNADIEKIEAVAKKVCQDYGPFHIRLNGLGVFGNRRNPRVLWVGLAGDLERLSDFRGALQRNMRPFGIKEEKRQFKPHLTLGRFRKGPTPPVRVNEALSSWQDLTSDICGLDELVLFKSDLRPEGAVHTRLYAWPLKGGR